MESGFNLIYGNDAEALVGELAERLRAPLSDENLLAPEIILVPQFGLRRWLEIRLAEKCGIWANVQFFAPAEYAWQLLRAVTPDLHETSLYDRRLLRWRVFAELKRLVAEPGFAELRASRIDDDASVRLHFAGELAQVLERYLAYRADMLAAWERGEEPRNWQAELWRRLVRGADEPHRARLLADYIRRYDSPGAQPPGVPPRLFAFACTNISPDLLRFYDVVSRHCALDFLMPTPCREFWGDVRSERERLRAGEPADDDGAENALLAANARAGREFVEQLFSYDLVQPTRERDISRDPRRATVLHAVQSDILNRVAVPPPPASPMQDRSIQFHVCHSRLREVQVLHDELIDLFQRNPALTPRDVAIMAPDIAAYAPYIEAVFGGLPREDVRYLPYTLSDINGREAHPLIGFALKLFELPLSRMGLAETMELLAMPAAQRKLGLDVAEFDRLVAWLQEAGVRWGLDAAQHEAFGAGRYREFSWAFGIERLLIGYASGDGDAPVAGIAPAHAIEGSAAQSLGALLRALGCLQTLLRAQHEMHSPREWQQLYNTALDGLLAVDEDDRDGRRALESIRETLAEFADEAVDAKLDEKLDWQCVRDVLGDRLAQPQRSYRYFSGGISVSSMLPLRVVPFHTICLIGMNDDAFPRRDRPSPLNRPDHDKGRGPRRGDRSDRDDDRYLFLQLLTAARDVFYLSWIGEEQRDGAKREPSAVVAELLDVLARQYFHDETAARKALVVTHPLQPFSAQQFDGRDARLFTYRDEWRRAAASAPARRAAPAFVDGGLAPPAPLDRLEIDREDFLDFWRNPAWHFFVRRLGLHLSRREDAIDDADPLELQGLARHRLLDAMVRLELDAPRGGDASWFDHAGYWRARGLLPAGDAGTTAFGGARAAARALSTAVQRALGDAEPVAAEPFSLVLDDAADSIGVMLIGTMPEHQGHTRCCWTVGRLDGPRRLRAWIDHLILATQRPEVRSILLGWDRTRQQVEYCRFHAVSAPLAREQLCNLVRLYRDGQTQPLLFFPRASLDYAERWRKKVPADMDVATAPIDSDALQHVHVAFTGTRGDPFAEANDAACALAVRGRHPFDAPAPEAMAFARAALIVYAPLLAASGEPA